MYDAILVPTDGSEGTRGAVDHAIDHAERYDADLHVLYVVDTRVSAEAGMESPGVLDALEETGQQAIDDVIAQAEAADVDTIEAAVANGIPHQAIHDYAAENDIDLIVMGTHGRTGLDRYLLGSVSEKVVRTSPIPVLTVAMPDD
jgi:nucleotide-binding universal stress UspA family protein